MPNDQLARRSPVSEAGNPCPEVLSDFLRQKRMMRNTEFCVLMGWAEETEKSRRARGLTPDYIKVGRAIYYTFDAVAAWLHETNTGTPVKDQAVADLIGVDIENTRGAAKKAVQRR